MVFVSRPRPAWHRTARGAGTQQQHSPKVATKQGQRCHHHYQCWFRRSCRGNHGAAEIGHFKKWILRLTEQLDLPYCKAGVCAHEGCTHSPLRIAPTKVQPSDTGLDDDTFHDALLIPHTRRRHRRLRKHKRIRLREKATLHARSCLTFDPHIAG